MAPDLLDSEGKVVSLEEYKGRCVVLDFWATWCPDCRKDIPEMKKLYSQYDSQGVEFIGVSFDTDKEVLNNYLKKESIHWRQVSELKKWKETTTSKTYHINWIPTLYLLDTDGKVILATVEIEKLKSKLEELKKNHSLVVPELAGQDHLAQFPGGLPVLMKFLSANIKYPREAELYGIGGRVIIKFIVEKDGTITNAEVEKIDIKDHLSLGKFDKYSASEKQSIRFSATNQLVKEALRVVDKMPKWDPAMRRGKPARAKYSLPITFNLP
jgi:thiol-disulfide isomerase/thioredoxin